MLSDSLCSWIARSIMVEMLNIFSFIILKNYIDIYNQIFVDYQLKSIKIFSLFSKKAKIVSPPITLWPSMIVIL